MTFENKKVIVVGLAKSGISAIKVLSQIGAKVSVTDIKKADQLVDIIEAIKPYVQEIVVGEHPEALDRYDIAVMSPGVPLDIPFVIQMKTAGIQIIGEIELAYQLCKGQFIGITGTNGKTTTTALTGEIFEASELSYNVVGNIGLPAVSKALEATEETFMITEISSFQLETILDFHAKVAAVLNLTPDHLNRHKTMAKYIDAKARIFENQDDSDALVLNYDDVPTRELATITKSRVHFFSRKTQIGQSAYIEDGQIVLNCYGTIEPVCSVSDLLIFGRHNEENALAASLICRLAGLDTSVIATGLKNFKGVEHRIEYTATVEGRKFYNDSKGTNPDSTICAIEAMAVPTHLIAGGYDKDSDFGPMIDVFGDKIKSLILLGATKHNIADAAREKGYEAIVFVESMEEAVRVAFERSQEGEAILLSPACASWDMYDNFEQRGEHFKACVHNMDQ
jgi:UDP-N-acetylmuramoylalanine--D-glutamate ligase